MIDRLKFAWRILTRKGLYEPRNVSYVSNVEPENKFVQLIPYRDQLLALDAQGKIWVIETGYGFSREAHYQLFMESPR